MYKIDKLIKQESEASVKPVCLENLQDILSFQDIKYVSIFEQFLKIGDKGYYAYIKDKCVHRSWAKFNEQIVYPHWTAPLQLKKEELYIHYCETASEVRGKNIYPHVLSTIIENNSNKIILISVNKKNISSIKGIEKVGFCKKAEINIQIILGFKLKRFKIIK
ncbi:MAG: hypothetical protein LBT51_09045 [Fusobacteriaceae bacterium]|nr:hypothetical protein [Fusobacteriaceae bacterium]